MLGVESSYLFIFLRLDELITLAATMADAEVLFSLNITFS